MLPVNTARPCERGLRFHAVVTEFVFFDSGGAKLLSWAAGSPSRCSLSGSGLKIFRPLFQRAAANVVVCGESRPVYQRTRDV
jgi:hypothetical protein